MAIMKKAATSAKRVVKVARPVIKSKKLANMMKKYSKF